MHVAPGRVEVTGERVQKRDRTADLAGFPLLRSAGRAVDLRPAGKVNRLHLGNRDSLPDGDFTIEAIVQLRSLYEDASVRTIAAQWDGNTRHAGWSLGVTSTKSKYRPRN